MAMQDEDVVQDSQGMGEADPWAAAFAAFDAMHAKGGKEVADVGADDDARNADGGRREADTDTGAAGIDRSAGAPDVPAGDQPVPEAVDGGPAHDVGEAGFADGIPQDDLLGVSDDEVESFREQLVEDVRDRATRTIAEKFLSNPKIRSKNGKLGATIDDSDICKRDSDGVPRFYNPDTGREFSGDNPRRQAQEWVDDYNRELAEVFNEQAHAEATKLAGEVEPQVKVLEFASTYDSLDPIRKGMFDDVIEDYEIHDENGDVIGYKCDLDAALATVNRQVERIQSWAKANAPKENKVQSRPAMDMPSHGAGPEDARPSFKNLAEAMEWEQDRILANRKKQ